MNPIKDGIYLNNRKLLIPWGTPINELENYGSPNIDNPYGDSIQIKWENEFVLGFFCDVTAIQILEEPNPRALHIYLPELYWVSLELHCEGIKNHKELLHFLKDRNTRLTKLFGEATFCYPDCEKGMPAIFWKLGEFEIGLSPSGWGANISVGIKPKGYPELTKKADRIKQKQGKGAAISPIQWPEID